MTAHSCQWLFCVIGAWRITRSHTDPCWCAVYGDVVDLSGRGDSESSEMDTRRMVRFPDSHQLFVGNLPHDIDESELKDFFMSMFLTKEPLSKQYEGLPNVWTLTSLA